jgi:hypothetical protein
MIELRLIDNYLFIGNRSAAQRIQIFEAFRFEGKVTVGMNPIPEAYRSQQIRYLFIKAEDIEIQDLLSYFPLCFRFIHKSIKNCTQSVVNFLNSF